MRREPSRPNFRVVHPVHFLALGFGSGLAPWMPGTFGTLAAIPVYLLVAQLPLGYYVALTVALFAVGVWLCDVTARDAGVHDHPSIVWDEIVGFLITMLAVPPTWYSVLAGFLLFRLFDILKPWPIRLLDRYVKGGFGIMVDDAVAGLFALPLVHLLLMALGRGA
jgi:phosphatidylglycerophosphatase A